MRRSSNLRRLLVATLGMVSVAAVTCGGGGEPAAQSQERKPGEKITMSFWSWVPGVDKAVDLWNSKNPDVQVKLEKIQAGNAGGYAKIHSALKSGKAPDLAQVKGTRGTPSPTGSPISTSSPSAGRSSPSCHS